MPGMKTSTRRLLLVGIPVVASAAAAVALLDRRSQGLGVHTAEGILVGNAGTYDRLAGPLLGGFYTKIADDVAATAGADARVLDVGCGPGHVLERLADRGLDAAGIDLDPAMVARASARLGSRAEVAEASAAALPFPGASFDVVVTTLSLHHWSDVEAGLGEIARVLRPDGRVLIYDFGGAPAPLHGEIEEPGHHLEGSALALVSDTPWRWPGPIAIVRRIEARKAPTPAMTPGSTDPARTP